MSTTIPAPAPALDDASVRALLDDIFWQAMQGAQQRFTEGNAVARRYAHGFSPIVAFADREHPDFAALAPFCDVGERFYCDSWAGPAQPGWEIALESTMLRMVWDAPMPDADPAEDAIALQPAHAAQAVALATLTNPGPFGPRTPELNVLPLKYPEAYRLYKEPAEYFFNRSLHVFPGFTDPPGYVTEASVRARYKSQVRAAARSKQAAHDLSFDEMVENGYIVVGGPDTVREQLEAASKELNIGNLCAMLQFGNMNDELTRYNTQLFGEKVAPDLRGMFSDWEHPFWPANAGVA